MGKYFNQRNAKVDANQPKIVKALRSVGAVILHTHTIKNAFDILVGYKGKLFIMEIKNDEYLPKKYQTESDAEKRSRLEKMLKDGEKECMKMFQSVGVPYHIVATIDEAFKIINNE
jgi:hypothetical protein